MTSYEHRAEVEMGARELFEFLARPESLPQHLPGLAESTPRVDQERRALAWEEGGYRGELAVHDKGPGLCEVVLAVETDRDGDVRRELEEAVAAITHRSTAEAESSATQDENQWY